jgi:para-nitrobenzyl esterase
MMCTSRFLAETVNKAGGQAWVYYFDRQRTGDGGQRLGVYHGAELPYVFDRHDDWLPTTDEDRALSPTHQWNYAKCWALVPGYPR